MEREFFSNSNIEIKTMREIEKEGYKRIPFEILIHFADFCDKNNIRYSLAYGTLLGAIRHKGFIPWDDDIDVIMPRADYERFKTLYHSERYPFSDVTINKQHATGMGKIYDSQTFFYFNKIKRSYGLFVDVFVVDNFPTNQRERLRWQKWTRFFKSLNSIKQADLKGVLHTRKSFLGKARILLYKLLPIPISYIQKKLSLLSQKYDATPTGLVGITMSCDNPFDTYPANFFEEYVDVEFEGRTFKAIRQYDKWLQICYGDYMQLPPVEKRVGRHHITAYYK